VPVTAVLFDFGHTLFDTPSSVDLVVAEAALRGVALDRGVIESTWLGVRERSRGAEEMAKGRDLSPLAHRRCWLDLFAPFDDVAPGLAEALYAHETSPAGWVPYPDAPFVVEALAGRGVAMGVVSDTGWDIRPVFEHHGLARHMGVFVLSGEHGVTKPATRLFELACSALDAAPATTLMVGDNHRTDGGAIESGLQALLLPLPPPGARRGLEAVLRLVG